MLAVVEDEEQPTVPQLLDQRVQGRLVGVVVQAEGVGGGERDECRVVQAGEVREAHAVREGPLDPGGDPRGEPGLADAAGSGQRDQPCARPTARRPSASSSRRSTKLVVSTGG